MITPLPKLYAGGCENRLPKAPRSTRFSFKNGNDLPISKGTFYLGHYGDILTWAKQDESGMKRGTDETGKALQGRFLNSHAYQLCP